MRTAQGSAQFGYEEVTHSLIPLPKADRQNMEFLEKQVAFPNEPCSQ